MDFSGEGATLHSDQAIPDIPSHPAQVGRQKRWSQTLLGRGERVLTGRTLTEDTLPVTFDLAAPLDWLGPIDKLSWMGSKRMRDVSSYHLLAITEYSKSEDGTRLASAT